MRFGTVAALAALWLTMLLGGTGALDHRLLGAFYAADSGAVRGATIFVTNLGEWTLLIPLTLLGAAWLLYRRERRSALVLVSITLIGRMLVELQKTGFGRIRPGDQVHLVPVSTLSFPSGHAANTMIVFLSFALLAATRRFRHLAVVIAVIGSLAVGATRPMLGVHWPSDVVGGWAFGAAWVLLMLGLAEGFGRADTGVDRQGRGQ